MKILIDNVQELMRTVITLSQAQIDALPADKQVVFTALVCSLSLSHTLRPIVTCRRRDGSYSLLGIRVD